MSRRPTRGLCLAAWLLLLPRLHAASPAPPSREVPPDRGRIYLKDRELRVQLRRLADSSLSVSERIQVIGVFALTREKVATPLLVKIVRSREPVEVRVAALWGIGEIGDPRGIVALQYALGQIYAEQAAWRYGKGITVPGAKEPIPVRDMCEQQLGRLAEPAVEKFAKILLAPLELQSYSPGQGTKKTEETDADGRRRAALITLAAIGDNLIAVNALCRVLTAEDAHYPWDFKIMAAQALSSLVEHRRKDFKGVEAKDHMADVIADAFIKAVTLTELPEVREIVGWTLRHMGWADRAAKSLILVLQTQGIPKVLHYRIIEALADIQSKVAVSELIFRLHDPDRNVRWRAAIALGLIRDPKAIPYLRKLTRDRDRFIRTKAVAALGHIEAGTALPDLAVATEDIDFRVRREACRAIGRIGRPQGIPALVRALKDSRTSVRAMAVIGLAYIGRAEGLKAAVPLVQDREPSVRQITVQVLDRFLNPWATEALIGALGDKDAQTRGAARRSVQDRIRRRPTSTIPLLVQVIADSTNRGRLAAIEIIDADYRLAAAAKTGRRASLYDSLLTKANKPLATALTWALDDKDPKVRHLAAKFLCQFAAKRKDSKLLETIVEKLDGAADPALQRIRQRARSFLMNLRRRP